MDTPGFLDPNLSECRILKMITDKLDDIRRSANRVSVNILYFQPITDIRFAGMKRRSVDLLRGFANAFMAKNVDIITTMWNTLWKPEQHIAANTRFECLRNEVFQGSRQLRINVYKYLGTRASSLLILDNFRFSWVHNAHLCKAANQQMLGRDHLLERISNGNRQLCALSDELNFARDSIQDNPILGVILKQQIRDVKAQLWSFIHDLRVVDPETFLTLQERSRAREAPVKASVPILSSNVHSTTSLSIEKSADPYSSRIKSWILAPFRICRM
ncbi:hypothetical protein CVT24_010022 [Panaeolus cyanescens]|uniref:AIG1-type G domain-containing protein n=1 Tax=Panaeolus cyanescens TaxID=181874 RepID=A0A409W3V5_9AGAR|nr:hypothetical protein CVT24_010022 [Panaeolus cyanescens]